MSTIKDDGRLAQISSFYDAEQTSGHYDDGYSNEVCTAEDREVAAIVQPLIRGLTLDIGAGNGLAAEIMDIPKYVGLELSQAMCKEASSKLSGKGIVRGDMHELPFHDESFDTVISLYGPMSYSLTPEELVVEIDRVLKPNGTFAIMPYTLRVGHKLDIGGYSTATEDSIEKKFYTKEMLLMLFSAFEEVEVRGVNLFLNTLVRFSTVLGSELAGNVDVLTEFLKLESQFRDLVPSEFYRHMIVTGKKTS